MEQLLNKIFSEYGYESINQDIQFYTKQDKSFFFSVSLDESVFKLIKNKDSFNNNPECKTVMNGFKSLINSGDQIAMEKNSSLLVLVKCTNITALGDLQNQILFFEEDEYFLKKYVILYTDAAIYGLKDEPIMESLNLKVNNIENFKQFSSTGFSDVIAEYLLIIQLFIKLPFLKLSLDLIDYNTLNQKLLRSLGSLYDIYIRLVQRANEFQVVDFNNAEDETKINELMNLLPND